MVGCSPGPFHASIAPLVLFHRHFHRGAAADRKRLPSLSLSLFLLPSSRNFARPTCSKSTWPKATTIFLPFVITLRFEDLRDRYMCVYDVSRVRRRHERFILENGGVIVLEHRKRSVSVIINCATWLPFSRSFLKSFHVSIVQNFEKERMEDHIKKGEGFSYFNFPSAGLA